MSKLKKPSGKGGRKPLPEGEKKIQIAFRGTPALADALKEIAREACRTPSADCERVMREYARQCGKIQ